MVATYIIILCLSAGLFAWASLRMWQRLAPMFGNRHGQTGLCAAVSAIAFLIVVGAPASVLFFACASIALMLLFDARMQTFLAQALWTLGAIGIALFFVYEPGRIASYPLPEAALLPITFISWGGVMFTARLAPASLSNFSLATIAACLPLALTPLLLGHESSVAIDAAIVATANFATSLQARDFQRAGAGAQTATALILGYMQIAALWQGAWINATASLVVWSGALAYARWHGDRPTELLPHA